MQPLEGLRILDLTSVLMGPYATSVLGDLGADVIKLEPPAGDIVRQVGPSRSGRMGGLFLHANASKRSLAIDLKTEGGRDAALRVLEGCDVLFYNLRPKTMAGLGLSYDEVRKVKPDVVYVGAFGFGQGGPYADRPAYDELIQTVAGVPALLSANSGQPPSYVPINIADRAVGLYAATVILAAVRHRDQTGEGQRIDVPMFETMASLVLGDHLGGLSFVPPLDGGGYSRLLSRHRKPYRTSDGFLCAVIYSDLHWQRFFELTGRPEQLQDPAFRTYTGRQGRIDEVYRRIEAIFLTRSNAEWLQALDEADIPCAALGDVGSLMSDPHLQAVGFFREEEHPTEGRIVSMEVPSSWSATPAVRSGSAPGLGAHTREVLSEAGYSAEEVATLIKQGCVKDAD